MFDFGGRAILWRVGLACLGKRASDWTLSADRYLRWRGIVPSQKWMNFYTKVLSKFANTPGLKIEVSFEVKVDQEHAEFKAAETRSGLKELGLEDPLQET